MSAYKDKRTNNWVASIRYVDKHGNRKRKLKRGFKRKSDALEWEREFLKTINEPMNEIYNFDEFFKMYITDISKKIRETTLDLKSKIYNQHIYPFFKETIINEIEVKDILNWQNYILKKNLMPTTNRQINTQLRAIFNHAERYYDLEDNPIKKVSPIGTNKTNTINFWTQDEFNKFISVINNEVTKIIFYVFFYTGIRLGELLAIQLKDINLDDGYIKINKSARYEKGNYIISKPKTEKSIRNVTLPNFLLSKLKTFIYTFYYIDKSETVFLTTPDRLYRDMKKYSKKANVKKIRIHELRHSHASLLIEHGVQPNIVQERLGHENIETTLNTYAHLYPNKQYSVAQFIDEIATGEDTNHNSEVKIPKVK